MFFLLRWIGKPFSYLWNMFTNFKLNMRIDALEMANRTTSERLEALHHAKEHLRHLETELAAAREELRQQLEVVKLSNAERQKLESEILLSRKAVQSMEDSMRSLCAQVSSLTTKQGTMQGQITHLDDRTRHKNPAV